MSLFENTDKPMTTQYAPMGAPVAGQPVTGQPYMPQQPGFAGEHGVRVNGMPMKHVKMMCHGREPISLGTASFLEADALANTWRAYLNTAVTPQ